MHYKVYGYFKIVNAGKKRKMDMYIASIFIFDFFGYIGKRRKRKEGKSKDLVESYDIKDLEDDFKGHDVKVFNFTSILEATMKFSPENKLGQGGYGPVYKVT